jgi:hypothetical protein
MDYLDDLDLDRGMLPDGLVKSFRNWFSDLGSLDWHLERIEGCLNPRQQELLKPQSTRGSRLAEDIIGIMVSQLNNFRAQPANKLDFLDKYRMVISRHGQCDCGRQHVVCHEAFAFHVYFPERLRSVSEPHDWLNNNVLMALCLSCQGTYKATVVLRQAPSILVVLPQRFEDDTLPLRVTRDVVATPVNIVTDVPEQAFRFTLRGAVYKGLRDQAEKGLYWSLAKTGVDDEYG